MKSDVSPAHDAAVQEVFRYLNVGEQACIREYAVNVGVSLVCAIASLAAVQAQTENEKLRDVQKKLDGTGHSTEKGGAKASEVKTFITYDEAAAMLDFSPATMKRKKCQGEFPENCYVKPSHKKLLFIREELEKWLFAQKESRPPLVRRGPKIGKPV